MAPTSPPTPEPEKTVRQRFAAAVAILAVIVILPGALAFVVAGMSAVPGAVVGAIYALLLSIRTGWLRAAQYLPVLVAVFAIGSLTTDTPAWPLALTVLAFAAGAAAHWGLLVPTALMGTVMSVAQPVTSGSDLLVRATAALLAGGFAIAIARRLGVKDVVPPLRTPLGVALVGGATFAVVMAAGATLAYLSGLAHYYWLPMTMFMLVIPTPNMRVSQRAQHRVLGTAVGVAVASPLIILDMSKGLSLGLAVIAMLLTLTFTTPLWLNSCFMAMTMVFALNPAGGGLAAGETRLLATLLAAVMVLAGAGVFAWWLRRHPGDPGETDLGAVLTTPPEDEPNGAHQDEPHR